MRIRSLPLLVALFTAASLSLSGCKTLQQITALKSVDFAINSVNQVNLAGVNFDEVRSYNDLNVLDVGRIVAAVGRDELPLRFTLNLAATNPSDNPVNARMVGMDWTLLLDDRETISGSFNDPRDLPPGIPVAVPIGVELNLISFFRNSAQDLVELVAAVAGVNGAPKRVSLRARPSIDTPLGPIRYPNEITIVSREVGG
ncbi:MAG: hypothetical protein JJ896_09765 [Rhodothermales bacterium]|nr:hypothetical protein [Rhodothermales bacterium]MBO6779926.1 hypothetical protein [Rhodothermales bacterium]